jgi:hypothetical protein
MALKAPRKQRNHQTDHHQDTHTHTLSLSLSLQILPMEEDVDPPVGCAKKTTRRDVDLQTETALFQTVLCAMPWQYKRKEVTTR